jgi:predicted enzyme related to lactoylglutathione lyase
MNNVIDWFEIPTGDLARSAKFYEAVLGVHLKRETFGGVPQAMFLGSKDGVGGALIQDARRKPTAEGTLVYLNAGKDLDGCLSRAVSAGGRVVLPKTDIGEPGFIAIFADPDGNTVGLHAARVPSP